MHTMHIILHIGPFILFCTLFCIFCKFNIFSIFNKFVMYWQLLFCSVTVVMADLLYLPRPWTTAWWMTARLFQRICAAGQMSIGWCGHRVNGLLWSITKSMPNSMQASANSKMIGNCLVDIWHQEQRKESFLWHCTGPKYHLKVQVVLWIFITLCIFCIL